MEKRLGIKRSKTVDFRQQNASLFLSSIFVDREMGLVVRGPQSEDGVRYKPLVVFFS